MSGSFTYYTMESDIVGWSDQMFGSDLLSHKFYSNTDIPLLLRRDLFTTDLFRTQRPISDPFRDGALECRAGCMLQPKPRWFDGSIFAKIGALFAAEEAPPSDAAECLNTAGRGRRDYL